MRSPTEAMLEQELLRRRLRRERVRASDRLHPEDALTRRQAVAFKLIGAAGWLVLAGWVLARNL